MSVRRSLQGSVTSSSVLAFCAIVIGFSLTACGSNSPSGSDTMAPGDSATPWPSGTDTEIPIENPAPNPVATTLDKDAMTALEAALAKSTSSAKSTGLTEVWTDSEGTKSLVVVWDQKTKQSITLDIELESAEVGEFDYMTPAIAQADLDAIKAGDPGFVNYTEDRAIYVKTSIDGEDYVTTYVLDASGNIASAKTYVSGDLLGEVVFTYSITEDGKNAIAAVE